MNKSEFISALEKPSEISSEQLSELEKLAENFPYFQLGHQLVARAHMDSETSLSNEKLKQAAIYSLDRKKLRQFITQPSTPASGRPATHRITKNINPKTSVKPLQHPKGESKTSPQSKLQPTAAQPKISQNSTDSTKPNPTSNGGEKSLHVEKLVIPEEIKKELEGVEITKSRKVEREKESKKSTQSKSERPKHSDSPDGKTEKPEADDHQVKKNYNPAQKPPKTEFSDTSDSKLNFRTKSNYDYFNDISNVKLENLIPDVDYDLTQDQLLDVSAREYVLDEPEDTPDLLIPDGLGMALGIWESRLGDVLLSSKQLKDSGNKELIMSKEITPQAEQHEIIEEFLENLPKLKVKSTASVPLNQTENLAKKKLVLGNDVTETMAEIYLGQGNKKKAKKIFERLMLKFPEKKAYFAKKIREIKKT